MHHLFILSKLSEPVDTPQSWRSLKAADIQMEIEGSEKITTETTPDLLHKKHQSFMQAQ